MTCRQCWHFHWDLIPDTPDNDIESYRCDGPHNGELTAIEVDNGCDQFATAKDKEEWERIVNRNW